MISLLLCAAAFLNAVAQTTTPLPPKESALSTWQMIRGGQQLEGVQYQNGGFSTAPVFKWKASLDPSGTSGSRGLGEGEATAGDVNGDGKTDVVQGATNGTVFVFDGSTGATIWNRSGVINQVSPVIADVNADGKMDVLCNAGTGLYLLDGSTGTTIWYWKTPAAVNTGGADPYQRRSISSCPNVSDLEKDGIPEAVVLVEDGVYVINGVTGVTKWHWGTGKPCGNGFTGSAPAIGDMNNDGYPDIVAAVMNGQLGARNGGKGGLLVAINGLDSSVIWSTTAIDNFSFASPVPAIGDLDGDCKNDVTYNMAGIRGTDGAVMWGIPSGVSKAYGNLIVDITNDCSVEVVAQGRRYSTDTLYGVWALDGATGNVIWSDTSYIGSGWFAASPRVGDFDPSNPGKEVLVAAAYQMKSSGGRDSVVPNPFPLQMYSGTNGAVLWTYDLATKLGHTVEGLSVADVDDDGCVELIVTPDCCAGEATTVVLDDIGNATNCGVWAPINQLGFLPTDTTTCSCVDFRNFSSACANTFKWSFSGGTPATSTAENPGQVCFTDTGKHEVQLIVNYNGCKTDTIKHSITVGGSCLPSVTVNSDTICVGDCASLSAIASGTAPFTYSWTGGLAAQAVNTICPTVTTSYIVTMTDSLGNTASDTATVVVRSAVPADAGTAVGICKGDSTTLNPSGGIDYVWSGGKLSCTNCQNPVASPTATTIYTVSVTDANGCMAMDTVSVIVNELPTVSAGPDHSVCPNTADTLRPSGALTYLWNADPTLSCTACTNPVATPTGVTTYTVTGTDANGCSATASVNVSISSAMTVDAGVDQSICAGATGVINVFSPGATTYSWNPTTDLSCTGCGNPTTTPTATRTYIVTAFNGGCTGTDTITITLVAAPTADAGVDQTICPSNTTVLNGAGASNITWLFDPTLSCTTCPNPTATPTATTTYYLVVTDPLTSCSDTDDVKVDLYPVNITAGTDTAICGSGSVILNPTGGVSYVWNLDPTLSCTNCQNPQATPVVTITYSVTGTDVNNCSKTAAVTVAVYAPLVINAGNDTVVCSGSFTTLHPTGAATYSWFPNIGLSCDDCPSPNASPLSDTTYYVIGTDVNGCTDGDSIHISVKPSPYIIVGPDTTIQLGSSVQLFADGAKKYDWIPETGLSDPHAQFPIATPDSTTEYCVSVVDTNGCESKDCMRVTVDYLCAEVFVPTAFSPNGDKQNDVECVLGNCIVSMVFTIYDRWGEKIFETTDPKACWDGVYHGKEMNSAVFAYTLNATLINGKTIEKKGNISLIR